jgi:hypothetical protein
VDGVRVGTAFEDLPEGELLYVSPRLHTWSSIVYARASWCPSCSRLPTCGPFACSWVVRSGPAKRWAIDGADVVRRGSYMGGDVVEDPVQPSGGQSSKRDLNKERVPGGLAGSLVVSHPLCGALPQSRLRCPRLQHLTLDAVASQLRCDVISTVGTR